MESLISYLPKVYDKALEFDISIHDAQFNHEGRYFLKLSIQSLHTNDYSSIQVRKPKTNVFTNDYEVETDVVRQPESQVLARFHDNKFTFRLPTGFCKNDKNHDVYLLVEAFSLPDNGEMGKKVGEGKFAIYPRPNAPKIRAYVERGEDFYNYTDIISLLRTLSTDSVQMHCGRVRANYALREMVPVKPRSPILTPPPKRKVVHRPTPRPKRLEPPPQPSPTSSWGHDKLSLQLPESPELPPLSTNRQLTERPLGEKDNSTFIIGNAYRHVASKGKEQIDMILHGATSLPMTQEEKVPKAFVVSNVRAPHEKDQGNGAVTHTSLRPTTAPAWEEMVHCETTEETAKDENLMLSVADGPSKQELVDYIIPLHYLKPFHQYHLELVKQQKGVPNGVRVFATITRKLPQLPKDPACPNYLGLEVLLQSVQKPLQTSPGPLIAVARIVPDFYNYKSDYLVSHPRTAGVTMTSVTFPSPHPSAFIVPPRTKHGYPQISLPGRPDVQPKWNHPYLFCDERDKATIFTPSAALVIEYYVATTAMSDQFWRVKSPMGFSALQMDQDMYKELIKDNAKKGLRVEGLPIQGSDVVTVEGKQPTVGMILRLITTNEPDSMVQVSNMEDLPVLDLYPEPSLGYYRTGDGGKTPEVLTVTFADEKSLDTTAEEGP
ncbi:hypothetical protein FSP39_019909 [Pinctada imbricata]|uniref:Uncharacterized protein n=1 Tax=Pinctada imbricata TaxID=66713 RepID=A0AA88Y052_PINIB|nr:hypothetical protein FSP39_019909 [Pinctada imbricata]